MEASEEYRRERTDINRRSLYVLDSLLMTTNIRMFASPSTCWRGTPPYSGSINDLRCPGRVAAFFEVLPYTSSFPRSAAAVHVSTMHSLALRILRTTNLLAVLYPHR
jgi:hypothetical protein